jgi:hypothetical protein
LESLTIEHRLIDQHVPFKECLTIVNSRLKTKTTFDIYVDGIIVIVLIDENKFYICGDCKIETSKEGTKYLKGGRNVDLQFDHKKYNKINTSTICDFMIDLIKCINKFIDRNGHKIKLLDGL